MNPYTYLFIREDLSHPQQIVQTAHAIDELNKRRKPQKETNFMVLCAAKSDQELMKISVYLDRHEIDHHLFYEPDIEAFTAIATEPLRGDRRIPLRKFNTKK